MNFWNIILAGLMQKKFLDPLIFVSDLEEIELLMKTKSLKSIENRRNELEKQRFTLTQNNGDSKKD